MPVQDSCISLDENIHENRHIPRRYSHCTPHALPWSKSHITILKTGHVVDLLAPLIRRFEERLKHIRRNIEDLGHDLLEAQSQEQVRAHHFSIGHGHAAMDEESTAEMQEPTATGQEGETANTHAAKRSDSAITLIGESPLTASGSKVDVDRTMKPWESEGAETANSTHAAGEAAARLTGATGGSSSGAKAGADDHDEEANGVIQNTQAAGENAIEAGNVGKEFTKEPVEETTGQEADSSENSPPLSQHHPEYATVARERHSHSKTLPSPLAQEIGNRAFPLAEEGTSCAAFHALAAEAVWAGFTGSDRVERPPESVWDPRGGDRWGTAAFFADRLGERESEAVPGLPQCELLKLDQKGGVIVDGNQYPTCSGSMRHTAARAIRFAAVSSRRGFLKHAAETAAKEVRLVAHVVTR